MSRRTLSSKNRSSDQDELGRYERLYARLRRELGRVGFLWVGTVLRQYHPCRQRGCRCRRGGRFRHGPYYVWTRKIKGKTVTRMLSEEEGQLYVAWIQNRRKLDRTVRKMQRISQRVAPLILRRKRGK